MGSVITEKRKIVIMLIVLFGLLVFCAVMSPRANADEQYDASSGASVPIKGTENTTKGILLEWEKRTDATGYCIFRKDDTESEWQMVKRVTNKSMVMWKDKKDMVSGKRYVYRINATGIEDADAPDGSNDVSFCFVSPVAIKIHSYSNENVDVTWNASESCDGYELGFSSSPFFVESESEQISGSEKTSFSGQLKDSGKYARIRAYKLNGDRKDYSCWSYSPKYKKTIRLTVKYIRKKGRIKDYRKWSKQKLYKHDVFQGACSSGDFSYNSLLYKGKNKAKLLKVDMRTSKIVRVGKATIKGHANSLTYNKDDGIIVSTDGNGKYDHLAVIDPQSLNALKVKKIKVPKAVYGASKSTVKKIKRGVTAISYDSTRKKYVARVRDRDDFVIMNRQFTVERYVTVQKKLKRMRQSIYCTKDMVACLLSPVSSKHYNIALLYDWNGNYIAKVRLGKKYELEDIYFHNGTLKGQVYHSFMKTIKKKIKVKVTVKRRSKKTGKMVRKKVRKKKTVKRKIFYREDYIFTAY